MLGSVTGLATEDPRSWLLYWRPFAALSLMRDSWRLMKALRYHARRPRGKTQIAATKACDTAASRIWPWPIRRALPHRAARSSAIQIRSTATPIKAISSRSCLMALRCSDWEIWDLWLPSPRWRESALLFKRLADIDAFDLELDVVLPRRVGAHRYRDGARLWEESI